MSWRPGLLAAPGIALGLIGLAHPDRLTYETSVQWTVLHVVGLFAFPFLGIALTALVWGRRDLLAWVVTLASYVYAMAYSALDIVAGISAGYVTYRLGPGVERPDEVRYLFDIGNELGAVGVLAFFSAAAVIAADRSWRHRKWGVIPGLLLTLAAVSFLDSHIYPWRGVVTMVAIGIATGWLAWLDQRGRVDADGQA